MKNKSVTNSGRTQAQTQVSRESVGIYYRTNFQEYCRSGQDGTGHWSGTLERDTGAGDWSWRLELETGAGDWSWRLEHGDLRQTDREILLDNMDNQTPEDLVQFLGSFTVVQCSTPTPAVAQRVTRDYRSNRKRRLSGSEPQQSPTVSSLSPPAPKRKPEPGPSHAVVYSTPSPVVDQKDTHDYSPKSTGSNCKGYLNSSESQVGSPTRLPLKQREQGQASASDHQGCEQRQDPLQQVVMPSGHYSQPQSPQPGHYLPTSNKVTNGHHYHHPMMPQQPVMSQQWWRCAHCNGQAVYHEDDWHYPCGRVKELTSHHVISEDMLRQYAIINGETLLEVMPPPPIPLSTNAPRPYTDYATELTSRQVPEVPTGPVHRGYCTHCGGQAVYHESDWHYPCGHVKELTSQHLISEDMLRPCDIEDGEIIYDVVPPPPRPITDCVMDATPRQVPKASQPPKKPKRTINPETLEIPTGFTRFRDQNWFKFRKQLGITDSKVIGEALQEHWGEMYAADRYEYEKQARTARYAARQIDPELCPSSPPMDREIYFLSLSKRKRRRLEKQMRLEKKTQMGNEKKAQKKKKKTQQDKE